MADAYIQMHFRLLLTMEANNMDPDQTDPKLGPQCLHYHTKADERKQQLLWQEKHINTFIFSLNNYYVVGIQMKHLNEINHGLFVYPQHKCMIDEGF